MANEEHLAILKKGVQAWNGWRGKKPAIKPDLEKANLSTLDLGGANLRDCNLVGANLGGAELSGANLTNADLTGVMISETELIGVNLTNSTLFGADLFDMGLSGAILAGADLSFATLTGVAFFGTDLSNSKMNGTIFADTDMSPILGLETVIHDGPSTIGIDTIYLSKGKIPEVFLRGAGVPEPFIREMKALVNAMDPIQFYSCFLSYSSKDQEFAERLYADLQQKLVRCWYDRKDMKIGDRIRPRIDEAIRLHDKFLLVLTENSVKSAWVEKEVETAFEKERKQGRTVLFPIRLDDAVMEGEEAWAADIRRTRHIGDFRDWKSHDGYRKAFERLMGDLKAS